MKSVFLLFLAKVSKFLKQIFLFSFEPKNERNYFLNSALASKMSQIKKMKALYYINYKVSNTIEVQCNLDLVTLNLVTTCDLVTIFQRPFFNLLKVT